MINLGWLGKSVVAMLIFILFYLLSNSIGRHFNTRPESIIAYYLLGASVGIFLWLITTGQVEILKITKPLIIICVLGVTLGALANVFLMQAIVEASNPGIPSTIIGSCGVFVYLIGPLLAIVLPRYFTGIDFNWLHLLGILMIFSGIGIISLK